MDKNTITGISLIAVTLVVFTFLNRPSEEQREAYQRKLDSIAEVQRLEQEAADQAASFQDEQNSGSETAFAGNTANTESVSNDELVSKYGAFWESAIGEESFTTIENNLIRLVISNKGGRLKSVELTNFQRYDSSELILFDGDNVKQNINFFAQNRNINTDEFYFEPLFSGNAQMISGADVPKGREGRLEYNEENGSESKSFTFRLNAEDGRYIDYVYSIAHNSYEVEFDIVTNRMNEVINANTGYLNFNFGYDVPRQEVKSKFGEDRYTTVYYKYKGESVDNLSLQKSEDESLSSPIEWIGYKQLFFSTILRSDDTFANAMIESEKTPDDENYIARFSAEIGLPYKNANTDSYGMAFYFGPNHYNTLKDFDKDYEKLINLGWPVVREVNKYVIIPIFNWLHRFIDNFGLIILILTVFIKMVVFPFTYKSYQSQAKMKALKPEIDEINKKYPADKAMERQQATMALYKKVGVSPMGGCLPMLFQMPILIAMFYFFPGSIELRQESFLWATDLSTYDSILSLPFTVPFGYGDHVSLFTLLMTVTSIFQTRMTGQNQTQEGMPGMKMMMYMMPLMFLFIFNSYSSGLSYYYFLANVITIVQTILIRRTIDEDALRAQLMTKKSKKGAPKKSKFQKRLEDMAKQQGVKM